MWDAQSRGSEGAARPPALTSSQWLPCPPLRAAGPFTLPGPGATQGGGNLRPPLGELSDLTVALPKGRAVGAPVLGPPAQGAPWVVSPRRGPPGPDLEGFVPARLPGSVSGSVLGPRHRVKLLADLGCQVAESSPDFYTVQALWDLRYPSQLQVQQGLWYLNGILLFIFLYLCVTLISFFINPENPSKWPSLSPLLLNTVVIKSHRCVVEDPKLAGRSPVGSAGHLMPRAPIIFCHLSRTCSQPHCTAPPESPHLPSAPWAPAGLACSQPHCTAPQSPHLPSAPWGTCGLGLQAVPQGPGRPSVESRAGGTFQATSRCLSALPRGQGRPAAGPHTRTPVPLRLWFLINCLQAGELHTSSVCFAPELGGGAWGVAVREVGQVGP